MKVNNPIAQRRAKCTLLLSWDAARHHLATHATAGTVTLG